MFPLSLADDFKMTGLLGSAFSFARSLKNFAVHGFTVIETAVTGCARACVGVGDDSRRLVEDYGVVSETHHVHVHQVTSEVGLFLGQFRIPLLKIHYWQILVNIPTAQFCDQVH